MQNATYIPIRCIITEAFDTGPKMSVSSMSLRYDNCVAYERRKVLRQGKVRFFIKRQRNLSSVLHFQTHEKRMLHIPLVIFHSEKVRI
jgi:hypothetical protein